MVNTEVFTEYLRKVHEDQRKLHPEGPLLFLFDAPSCHGLTVDVIQDILGKWVRNDILQMTLSTDRVGFKEDTRGDVIFTTFPHNTTLTLQPCDNGPFRAFKKAFNKGRSALNLAGSDTNWMFAPERFDWKVGVPHNLYCWRRLSSFWMQEFIRDGSILTPLQRTKRFPLWSSYETYTAKRDMVVLAGVDASG